MWSGIEFPACENHFSLYVNNGAIVIAPPVPVPETVPAPVPVPDRTADRDDDDCVCGEIGEDGKVDTHFGEVTELRPPTGLGGIGKTFSCENHLENYLKAGWEFMEGGAKGKGKVDPEAAHEDNDRRIEHILRAAKAGEIDAIDAVDTIRRQTEMIDDLKGKICLLEYTLEYIETFDEKEHKVTAAKAFKMVREVARAGLGIDR